MWSGQVPLTFRGKKHSQRLPAKLFSVDVLFPVTNRKSKDGDEVVRI
jgi:hypothetical protein